jgi:RNA polymerase sigma factor (TIGR02999 family)
MMRRIVVDHARARLVAKRGGSAVMISFTDVARPAVSSPDQQLCDVLAIDEALDHLASRDPEQVRIVELRFFTGLSVEETAQVLDRSPRTIKREWRLAKAWLFRELRKVS